MRRFLILGVAVAAIAVAGLAGCQTRHPAAREGFVQVPGGRVWYRVVGSGRGTPLLVLHGGPGGSSIYLRPLEALANERPVVFYDQLGGGRSDRPADTTLWNTERFVEELARVREALGLKDVHLFGHSWGTIVVAEYMLTRHPAGVRSLILSGPALNLIRWTRDADSLRSTLPDSIQQVILRNERAGTTTSPEYQGAMEVYYHRFLERRNPWTPATDTLFAQLNGQIYNYMQGPSEFAITGTLKGYDRSADLPAIHVPTLFMGGEYDEAPPATIEYYHQLMPGSEMLIIPEAGHLTTQDKPEDTVAGVRAFLHRHEGGR